MLAGCTVVGEVSCRDIGRGVSADAGPAYWRAQSEGVSELRAGHRHRFPPPKKKKQLLGPCCGCRRRYEHGAERGTPAP